MNVPILFDNLTCGGGCGKGQIDFGDVGFVIVTLCMSLADVGVGTNSKAVEWLGGLGCPFAETLRKQR